jgi:L-amino acid N-acyltransferase YncA
MLIRPAENNDASAIAEIYNFYVLNSHATFETQLITTDEMKERLDNTLADGYPFFVAVAGEKVEGYAYGRRYRPRDAYKYSVEISVYIRPGSEHKGIGSGLYEALLPDLQSCGFHTIIAGISLPNDASIRLHERFAFKKVAHFSEVGHKLGRWIDVGYWQLIP